MSFARIAAIAAAAVVIWGGTASAAGPLRGFQAGLWSGGAYTDDRTGGFTHCSAGAAYNSGINMFILVTGDDRWWLGFINPQWSLAPSEEDAGRAALRGRTSPGAERHGSQPSDRARPIAQ